MCMKRVKKAPASHSAMWRLRFFIIISVYNMLEVTENFVSSFTALVNVSLMASEGVVIVEHTISL